MAEELRETNGEIAQPPPAPRATRLRRLSAVAGARRIVPLLSAALLLAWALFIGRSYLNLDPWNVPAGNEFLSVIQSHHFWTRLQTCGLCALWNGALRGGHPALVDPMGSTLHPIVAFTTLAFGVVNGAKMGTIAALLLAGAAQWWLGRELELSRPARLWGALMVMAAGHLAGRMELGLYSMVLATATVSLTFPALLHLVRVPSARSAVLLGAVLALVAVSGQGYMQAGYLVTLPAALFLFWPQRARWSILRRRLLTSLLLGFLLAAPFLLPFLLFFPNFVKDTDPIFRSGQPLAFYILNLLIDDPDFFYSGQLGKLPYPALYTMYIGWIPLLLAGLAVPLARRRHRPALLFLGGSAFIALLAGSTTLLRVLAIVFPPVAALRFAPMIGGLAVPPLIALASYGADRLWHRPWPQPRIFLGLGQRPPHGWPLPLKWLLLLPLVFALYSGYAFTQHWLLTRQLPVEVDAVLQALESPALRWVQTPFGEHSFIEPAVRRGLKLSPGILTWNWRDREWPQPAVEATRSGAPPAMVFDRFVGDVALYRSAAQPYAAVVGTGGITACTAQGLGGDIDVSCSNKQDGLLVLTENATHGWLVWRDGERVSRSGKTWLTVEAPSGEHTYRFLYLPWETPISLLLWLGGILLALLLWRRAPRIETP